MINLRKWNIGNKMRNIEIRLYRDGRRCNTKPVSVCVDPFVDSSRRSEWTEVFDKIHKHARRLEPCVNPSEQRASW